MQGFKVPFVIMDFINSKPIGKVTNIGVTTEWEWNNKEEIKLYLDSQGYVELLPDRFCPKSGYHSKMYPYLKIEEVKSGS